MVVSVIAFQQSLNVGFPIQYFTPNDKIRQDSSMSVFLQGPLADVPVSYTHLTLPTN